MDTWQSAANWGAVIGCAGTVAGLIARGRARRAWFFVAHLIAVGGYSLCTAFLPAIVTWRAWLIKELLLGLLTLAVALEIAMRVFARAPQTARTTRIVIGTLLLLTAASLQLDLPSPPRPVFTQTSPAEVAAFETAVALLPRLAYGTAWLCGALFVLATLGWLPLDPLHRVITIGFGAYLSAYTALVWDLPAEPAHARLVSDVLTWSYLGVLAVWAFAAWRREEFPQAARDVVYYFFPWLRR